MAHFESTRRDVLKGAAALAGSAALCAGASQALADEAAGSEFDKQTDVLVLGAGAGGCYAANFAMQQGASVIVVEAASKIGGTAILSGGFYHTWDIDADNVDEKLASADPSRRRLYME